MMLDLSISADDSLGIDGSTPCISDGEYAAFQRLMLESAGIRLPENKRTLVKSRLAKRLRHLKLQNYTQYLQLLKDSQHLEEKQCAINLLTTNETYFFREPKHFDFLQKAVLPVEDRPFRVWSAACSYGQEAYSIAMLLADRLGSRPWEIVATDISTTVLVKARLGHYSLEEARHIPEAYLRKYCLRGTGDFEGTFLVKKSLRDRIQFQHANLNGELPGKQRFDIIVLRNVMIYFNQEVKARLVSRLHDRLLPGGYFIIGHSETLNGINPGLAMVSPSIYHKQS